MSMHAQVFQIGGGRLTAMTLQWEEKGQTNWMLELWKQFFVGKYICLLYLHELSAFWSTWILIVTQPFHKCLFITDAA